MRAESAAAGGPRAALERYRSPGTVIARFVSHGIRGNAAILGCVFAAYAGSTIYGFIRMYNTPSMRQSWARTFGNNAGLRALFGVAHRIDTVRGFTAWRTLGILIVVGAVWGLAVATKQFRGEEEAGRTELFLSGQTTPRRAALNNMAGLGTGLFVVFAIIATVTGIVGNAGEARFGVSSILFYSFALILSAAVFMSVGALASQLAPTRRSAAGIAAAFLGVSFFLRAIGDAVPGVDWLRHLSPLGWIFNLRPLTGTRPLWLLPILGLVALFCGATVYIAGKRDLGASLVRDSDSRKPRTRTLGSLLGLTSRETRNALFGWVISLAGAGFCMGAVSKAAGEAMAASDTARTLLEGITGNSAGGATAYLGNVFLMFMAVLMAMAASCINSIREDEAEGYLDNLLVRPVSRTRWLAARLAVAAASVLLAGVSSGVTCWLGMAIQHVGIPFGRMVAAGVNASIPAAFMLGIGVLVLGLKPRWTSVVLYAIIGWCFLLEMLGPILKLNRRLLDTSLLHHVAMAPAKDPAWLAAAAIVSIAGIACFIGAAAFGRRDLAGG